MDRNPQGSGRRGEEEEEDYKIHGRGKSLKTLSKKDKHGTKLRSWR